MSGFTLDNISASDIIEVFKKAELVEKYEKENKMLKKKIENLENETRYPKRNLKAEHKEMKSITVPLYMDPVVWLQTALFYKEYINLIYRLGRGYMYVSDIVDYFKNKEDGKSKTIVYKELKEIEWLKLIEIVDDKDRFMHSQRYVFLKRNALCYIHKNSNQADLKYATKDAILYKSRVLMKLYNENKSENMLLKKSSNRYERILRGINKNISFNESLKQKHLRYIEEEIKRYNKLDGKPSSREFRTIDELEQQYIYMQSIMKNEEKKLISKFLIIDTGIEKSTLAAKMNIAINFIMRIAFDFVNNQALDDITKWKDRMFEKMFNVDFTITTTAESRKNKIQEFIKDIKEDNLTYYEKQTIKRKLGYEGQINRVAEFFNNNISTDVIVVEEY